MRTVRAVNVRATTFRVGSLLYVPLGSFDKLQSVQSLAKFWHEVWMRSNNRIVRDHITRGAPSPAIVDDAVNAVELGISRGVGLMPVGQHLFSVKEHVNHMFAVMIWIELIAGRLDSPPVQGFKRNLAAHRAVFLHSSYRPPLGSQTKPNLNQIHPHPSARTHNAPLASFEK